MITTEKTAFVYGGKTANNTKIPVTVVYSDDKGENWTTCELDKIYTADYYYVKFFDSDNGVIVCGYGCGKSYYSFTMPISKNKFAV